MSKLRSINTAIWNDVWFENLNSENKLLFIYLITNEKTNMLGVYEISIRKISFDTGIKIETVSKALKEFEKEGKIRYESDNIILLNYLKHQNYNFNMKKSAINCYNSLKDSLKIENQPIIDRTDKGFETLCKGFGMVRKIEVEIEYELEEEIEYELEEEYELENKISEIKNFDKQQNQSDIIILDSEKENNQKEKVPSKRKSEKDEFIEAFVLAGAFEDYAEEYYKYRVKKKLSLSKLAYNKIIKESVGLDINEVIELCISKDWKGFKREWYNNSNNSNNEQQSESDPKIGRTRLSALEKLREQMLNQ